MIKYLFISFLFVSFTTAYGQAERSNHWYFGYQAGLDLELRFQQLIPQEN